MHMNKLTADKFLLQNVRVPSENEHVDESYAKSFERANKMLTELESQHVFKATERGKDSENLIVEENTICLVWDEGTQILHAKWNKNHPLELEEF